MATNLRRNSAMLFSLSRHRSLPPPPESSNRTYLSLRPRSVSSELSLFFPHLPAQGPSVKRGILKYSNSTVTKKSVRFDEGLPAAAKRPISKIVKRIRSQQLRVLRHKDESVLSIQYLREVVDVYDTYEYTQPKAQSFGNCWGSTYFTLRTLTQFGY